VLLGRGIGFALEGGARNNNLKPGAVDRDGISGFPTVLLLLDGNGSVPSGLNIDREYIAEYAELDFALFM
jgi:hypothetical protein